MAICFTWWCKSSTRTIYSPKRTPITAYQSRTLSPSTKSFPAGASAPCGKDALIWSKPPIRLPVCLATFWVEGFQERRLPGKIASCCFFPSTLPQKPATVTAKNSNLAIQVATFGWRGGSLQKSRLPGKGAFVCLVSGNLPFLLAGKNASLEINHQNLSAFSHGTPPCNRSAPTTPTRSQLGALLAGFFFDWECFATKMNKTGKIGYQLIQASLLEEAKPVVFSPSEQLSAFSQGCCLV